jgi:iron complex outermembrane receptor protein
VNNQTSLRPRAGAIHVLPALGAIALAAVLPAAADHEISRLPVVTTYGDALDEDAAKAVAKAATRPGNVSVIPAVEFQDRYAVSLRDTLQFTPGVIAQPRFAEEVRLSIRGSGVANNAHLRGVELLFDGVPISAADGFGDYQELDPGFTNHLTVWRGANAFATGAASLGGAIDFAAITARNSGPEPFLRLEGGSYGTARAHGRAGLVADRFDIIFAGTVQQQDGYRANAQQSNGRIYANAGWRWNDRAVTRFGILGNDVNQEIPGALTIPQALTTPKAANAGAYSFRFGRDVNSWRSWTRTEIDTGALGTVTFGASYTEKSLYHPLSIVIDQHTIDTMLFARLDGGAEVSGLPVEWTIGTRWRNARTAARVFTATANRETKRGFRIGNSLQYAGGLDLYGELRVKPTETLTLLAGLNSIDTSRHVVNRVNPALSDEKDFTRVSPKLGVVWAASETFTVFSNLSGIYEPPAFGQLTQGGASGFTPIEAQEGVSFEIGVRGATPRLAYELTFYDARLDNEFIAFQTSPLIPAATFNAEDTLHRGIEAGLMVLLADDLYGGRLTTRGALTWSDFSFDGDRVYGDNTLAGVPETVVSGELAWTNGRLRIAPSVYVQSNTWVDFANTLKIPRHTLYNLSTSWQLTDRVAVFAEGRNLTDERHITMTSAIADAAAPGANRAVATPGDGLSVFGGVRLSLGGK